MVNGIKVAKATKAIVQNTGVEGILYQVSVSLLNAEIKAFWLSWCIYLTITQKNSSRIEQKSDFLSST